MAITAQAAALTAAYQVEQNKNGALAAYVVAQLWIRSIDPDNISGSAAELLARLIPLLVKRHDYSSATARRYYQAFRKLESTTGASFKLRDTEELNLAALETSLRVTGEVALKNRIKDLPLNDNIPGLTQKMLIKQAIDDTSEEIAGSAMRHVMNGGRDEIRNAVEDDPEALGWIRVTDGDPCFFCAMLASRGPVYDDESFNQSDPRFTGPGQHKVHDNCGCGNEPVFDRKTKWPGKASAANTAWTNLEKELGHVPTILEFRNRWEGRA